METMERFTPEMLENLEGAPVHRLAKVLAAWKEFQDECESRVKVLKVRLAEEMEPGEEIEVGGYTIYYRSAHERTEYDPVKTGQVFTRAGRTADFYKVVKVQKSALDKLLEKGDAIWRKLQKAERKTTVASQVVVKKK